MELLGKKPLEKITVKELAEKAQISKATFYLHYQDIYDLAERLQAEVIGEIYQSIAHPDLVLTDQPGFTRELFLAFRSHNELSRILFSGSRAALIPDYVERELKKHIFRNHPELKEDYPLPGASYLSGLWRIIIPTALQGESGSERKRLQKRSWRSPESCQERSERITRRFKMVVMTTVQTSETACADWMPRSPKNCGRIRRAGMKKRPCLDAARMEAGRVFPHGLHHHVVHYDPSAQSEGNALQSESSGADADDVRVITEDADQVTGQEHAGNGQQEEYNGRYFDAEPEGFPDSVVFAGRRN